MCCGVPGWLQDKQVKDRVDTRNKLETYLYNLKSTAEGKLKEKVSGRRPGWNCCMPLHSPNLGCGWGGVLQIASCFQAATHGLT